MKVLGIAINHFRNISSAELSFQERNLFVGSNGAGKTSVAEAVAVALNGRSFRTFDSQSLLQRGCDYWRTAISVTLSNHEPHQITMVGGPLQRERVQLDDHHVRITELSTRFPVISFVPEDRDLVVGLPAVRREYLDSILARSNPKMQRTISRANKILKQRQNLVRSSRPDEASLDIFDHELAESSMIIAEEREKVLVYLRAMVQEFNNRISGSEESLHFHYMRSWSGDPFTALLAARADDLRKGTTSLGFHRDDFSIELNGLPAKTTASQGQIRSLAIALRIGSGELLERSMNESPILLLDDVFAEFDQQRSGRLLDIVGHYQTFATTTEKIDGVDGWTVFEVVGGRVVSASI
ncbi:DNA replication and repair protein RecF [Ferrimicrobium sp.]|uniref:DNA replication/repair protein RecF n=1 Tax=Ferrimicrobium sp. TaxID=2926050 RepID=UPI002602DDA0|nr:DNA replication and repair protein RecF [Ferrimicrobium sp.]